MTAVSQSPLTRAPRGSAPRTGRPRGRTLVWIAEHAALVALGVLTIAPIVFVILTSLMSSNQALTASILPRPFDFSNYARVFTELPLAQWFGNSSMFAVLDTAFEEHLHPDADPEHRPATREPSTDQPVALDLAQPRHARGVRPDTRDDQPVGGQAGLDVGGQRDVGTRALDRADD